MANRPVEGTEARYWVITIPSLCVRYGIGGDPGARWLLDAETARRAKSEGWAEVVEPKPKPRRKA